MGEIPQKYKDAAAVQISDVEHRISQQLLQYMIPKIWIPVSLLPVNKSGKADRKLLEQWLCGEGRQTIFDMSTSQKSGENDLPASSVERQLRRTWSEVLNIDLDTIGYRQSFLSIGGDSITVSH